MPAALDIPQFKDAASSHPFLVRALNRLGHFFPAGGALTPETIWDAARKGDLGDCEPTAEAEEALDRLLQSLAENVPRRPRPRRRSTGFCNRSQKTFR
jgi:hypothetical protein